LDPTVHLLTQAVFRLSYAVCLASSFIPDALSPRWFFRANLGGLFALSTLATLLLAGEGEPSGADRGLLAMAAGMAVVSGLGALAWPTQWTGQRCYVVFALGLGAFLGALFSIRWNQATTGFGLSMALLDLASGGLLLAVLLSVIYLGLWYLCTPKMAEVRLDGIARCFALAVSVRILVTVVALAARAMHGDATALVAAFLVFRSVLPALGWWMLILLRHDVTDQSPGPRMSSSLFFGLFLILIGELGTYLVPLDVLYPL
jgi:hypothetical protein